jgi:multidrug efflux pump subunit AcrA (membrane-fusion protein)
MRQVKMINLFRAMKCIFYLILILATGISCREKAVKIKPSIAKITEAVYATATVQPVSYYTVYSAVAGIVEKRLISEGDFIQKGATLFHVKSTFSNYQVENAQLNYELLKDNYQGSATLLDELMLQLEVAQLKLANDSSLYEKYKRLFKEGATPEVELQQRQLAFESRQREVNTLVTQLRRTKTELANKLKISQNQINSAAVSNQEFNILSKMAGVVYEVQKEIGESVLPQEPLAIVGDRDSFIIELSVDQEDIARIQLGQLVFVTLEAYQKEVFEAKVTKIAQRMDVKTQTFLVESHFTKAPKRLYMGLSGEANIIIAEKENAIVLPKSYLKGDNTVITEQGEVTVNIGLKSLDFVELLSPVDTATFILQPE